MTNDSESNDAGVVMKRTYIRIRQNGPNLFDYKKIADYIEKNPKSDAFEIIKANESPIAYWGSGVYLVNEETGELSCMNANWDSSD